MGGFRFIRGLLLGMAAVPVAAQENFSVNLSGIVTDPAGTPIPEASVRLERSGLTAITGADGRFSLTGNTAILNTVPPVGFAAIRHGSMFLSVPEKSDVTITAYGIQGKTLSSTRRNLDGGSHRLNLPHAGPGMVFLKVESGFQESVVSTIPIGSPLSRTAMGLSDPSPQSGLAKRGSAALYDVITATKTGYLKSYLSISNSEMNNADIRMLKEGSPKFSFFVTSMKALQDLSKSQNGFGGDFRYGETGPGAGLRGADKLCAAIADRSMPGSSFKGWRAFLSVKADAYGNKVDAIGRIGEGPWYDRTGRLLAPTKGDLVNTRPANGDPVIKNDLPNENGIPNHRPDPTQPEDDNHHTVTGSTTAGMLKAENGTCKDWTSTELTEEAGRPSQGFSWPRAGVSGGSSGQHWMSTWDAASCGAGFHIINSGSGDGNHIGTGGGYGGFYCFALNP